MLTLGSGSRCSQTPGFEEWEESGLGGKPAAYGTREAAEFADAVND
jgi:hypothetical protein